MLVKDYATLEAEIANGAPSRLLIEIALRQPPANFAPAYDSAEIHRAIRDGFREVFAQVELQRLMKGETPRKSRAKRWFRRIVAFTVCAAIGSAGTLILSASHAPRPYALGSLTQPDVGPAALDVPSPGSQSRGAADAPAAPAGPATFGLHEQ